MRKMNPMVSKGNNKNIIAIAVVVLLVLLVIGLILWFTLGNESNNDKKAKKFGNNNPFERRCCDAKYVMRPRRVRRPNGGLDRRYFEALEANCNNNE